MTPATAYPWAEANQRYLTAAVQGVRAHLERHAGAAGPPDDGAASRALAEAAALLPAPAALDTVCGAFNLSPFERSVLVLCAGVELEASFAALVGSMPQGGEAPTFALALAALPEAHWSALTPGAPLRRWRLVEVGTGARLVESPLRIDERVLHYLAGLYSLDAHLAGFVEPVPFEDGHLAPSQEALAEAVAAVWRGVEGPMPVVQLTGAAAAGKRAVAAAATARLGLRLHVLPAHALPAGPHDLDVLMRLWEREAVLSRSALLIDADAAASGEARPEPRLVQFLQTTGGALFVATPERLLLDHRPSVTFEPGKPSAAEQRTLWSTFLEDRAAALNGHIDRLAGHFDLTPAAIEAACRLAAATEDAGDLGGRLWEACRTQARPRLADLAERIEPAATWDDLVLPALQAQTLREVAVHVRRRMTVYEAWGFGARSARGLGISALFAGPSGTGKTMAAEVLAHDLHLDLYRIDLSRVVSKYIGETEKNLARVFDAAEAGGAILLFDEADALFGKRSEVKDSHDRYANIEVSYLLQRMEAYRGLAILTTNLKSALDDAFLRRLRFVVTFPFPAAEQRAAIWARIFPAQTPTHGLDPAKLARLNVTGGNIRNIALGAAFLAAEEGTPVGMAHLLRAARTEYAKLERPLTDAEIRGWT
ncbi:MAG: ATP-binding protein [Rhodothermales bacterium]|nr:ATP-binding protein [Rhodothermales bacterium]